MLLGNISLEIRYIQFDSIPVEQLKTKDSNMDMLKFIITYKMKKLYENNRTHISLK